MQFSSLEDDTIKLPDACQLIESSDAAFEVLTSQTGQILELQHRGKFAGQMMVFYFYDRTKNEQMQEIRETFTNLFVQKFNVP